MKWTKEQTEAIQAGGENILLAAAAGSGKTAVLVERIIRMITDEKRDTDINRLLVLTFTEAAAKEMKNKISDAIESRLEAAPNDARLKRQRLLLGSANISTIHAFCLETLRANIHLTDIPADFSVCSENEGLLIFNDCMDKVLSQYYERLDKLPSFRALADGCGGTKSDAELRKLLRELYKFAVSMPDPVRWLSDTVREHKKVYRSGTVLGTVWDDELRRIILDLTERVSEMMEAELTYCEEYLDDFSSGSAHPYTEFFTAENEEIALALKRIRKELELEAAARYDNVAELFAGIEFKRLVSVRTKDCPEMKPLLERAKLYREIIKKEIKSAGDILSMPQSVMAERIRINYPEVKTLKNIIIRIMRAFKREKLRRGLLDFNDLEHKTLHLIIGKDGLPTETAISLRKRYTEILVDEYQDTNYIQDAVFKAVSRQNENIFMVGDMKQSIYMFRNAVPGLFLDKYGSYTVKDGTGSGNDNDYDNKGRLIRLNRNFRSRGEVIDTVNFVFSGLMSERLGDIEYNSNEALIQGAVYPKASENIMNTELIVVENTGETGIDNYELEARAAALKIKQLKGVAEVTDKESGAVRKAEYRDMVILIRNANSLAQTYENVFSEYGIPIYTGAGRTYLSSVEVRTVLAFLQIIDNPYQDIPLVAVMRSPMFGFTADELAEIRSRKRDGCFYEALIETVRLGTLKKADEFFRELAALRADTQHRDIHSLIWKIYYEYNYLAIAGAMDMGDIRRENLRLLYNRAIEFENSRFEGLFEFMNYIDNMVENRMDLNVTDDFGENADRVTLMSIHKSKGLEFPIVLLCGTSKRFNRSDISKPIIWNDRLGISLRCYDSEIRAFYPSVTSNIMSRRISEARLSEEMRLLYVALTRAKERLIIFAPTDGKGNSRKKTVFDGNNRIPDSCKLGLSCMRDWLLSVFMTHKDCGYLRSESGADDTSVNLKANFDMRCLSISDTDIVSESSDMNLSTETELYEGVRADEASEDSGSDAALENPTAMDCLIEKLFEEYKYGFLGKIPTKISVTELKRMKNEVLSADDRINADDSGISIFDDYLEGGVLPLKSVRRSGAALTGRDFDAADSLSFRSADEISGASRGTLIHFVMQHIDFGNISSADDVRIQIQEMTGKGMITEKQAESVPAEMILSFAESELCRRMINSDNVKKEFRFYTAVPLRAVYKDCGLTELGDESVFIQGIADCFFEEADGFVLIDYKTDNLGGRNAEKYSERYRLQLEYYQAAIESVFKKRVKEKYIYYLECAKSVAV